jgi:hypothetical protein
MYLTVEDRSVPTERYGMRSIAPVPNRRLVAKKEDISIWILTIKLYPKVRKILAGRDAYDAGNVDFMIC